MKKFDLGQTVGLLANLGVIAGIVFLGLELHQNNEVLESQSRDAWVDRQSGILETLALNPELLEVMLKGTADLDSLSNLEYSRYRSIGFRTLIIFEHQFDEMSRGRLEEREIINLQRRVFHARGRSFLHDYGTEAAWEEYDASLASPGFRAWFQENVVDYAPISAAD